MEKTALEIIERHKLIEKGDGIVLGLSGGADSTALFMLLCSLKERHQLKIHGVHVHHGLRGVYADRDEAFSRELCSSFGVSFHAEHLEVEKIAQERGLSFEMAGRELRYEVFEKERFRLGYQKIAVAHHRDDQGETILLRLIRGSGLEGLVGIRPSREGCIIRPLLMCSRKQIEAYCASKNIQPMTDHTNLDSAYSRNFLRNEIIPQIDAYFGGSLNRQLSKTAHLLSEDGDYIQSVVETLWYEKVAAINGGYRIEKKVLQDCHSAIRSRLIRKMYSAVKGDLKDLEQNHVAQISDLLSTEGYKTFAYKGVLFYGEHQWISGIFDSGQETIEGLKDCPSLERMPTLKMEPFDNKGDLARGKAPRDSKTIEIDEDTIVGSLSLRHRLPGDQIIPLGMTGHKKIKDLLIDAKVPLKDRDKIWLICDDEKIIWVYGIRQHEHTRVTKNTRQILKLWLSDVVPLI